MIGSCAFRWAGQRWWSNSSKLLWILHIWYYRQHCHHSICCWSTKVSNTEFETNLEIQIEWNPTNNLVLVHGCGVTADPYIEQQLRPLTLYGSFQFIACLSVQFLNRGKACTCNATQMHRSFLCLCIQCNALQMQCNANGRGYALSLQQCAVHCIPIIHLRG